MGVISTIRFSAAVLLIVLHLGGAFADLAHEDFIGTGSFNTQEAVGSHDCGPKERHITLDAEHFCIPCYRLAAGVASQNADLAIVPPPSENTSTTILSFRPKSDLFPPTYHRGPPSSTILL